jgi:hypothetical protein
MSNPDLAAYLGALAFVARDSRYALLRFLSQKDALDAQERSIFSAHVDYMNRLRSTIGQYFTEARDSRPQKIKLRECDAVFRYLDLRPGESFGVISGNWDELLFESTIFSKHLIALHGRASEPESLILPLESTADDVIVDLFLKYRPIQPDAEDMALVKRAFREQGVREQHDYVHQVAMRWFGNAKRIVMWGVAFNAYDGELISLIPKDDRKRSLVIINPDPKARDVAGTILCGNSKERLDYDPVRCEEIVRR